MPVATLFLKPCPAQPWHPVPGVLGAAALALGLLSALPVQAVIGSYGTADSRVSLYVDGSPPQTPSQFDSWGTPYVPAPPGTAYTADAEARAGGNSAVSFAAGDLGMLKASSAASFGPRFQPGVLGNAFSNASAGFNDEWLVQGAGLVAGTPVTLLFTVHINGTHSGASTLYGTSQRAGAAVALVGRDVGVGGLSQNFNWGSGTQSTGNYQWAYNTFVGRTVALSASLSTLASVDQYSSVGSMYADFGHTINLYLAPSLAGVGSVSLGGHDYALPAVPEPATWAVMLLGLAVLGARLRRAR
jgi:PEP-CTERM motif